MHTSERRQATFDSKHVLQSGVWGLQTWCCKITPMDGGQMLSCFLLFWNNNIPTLGLILRVPISVWWRTESSLFSNYGGEGGFEDCRKKTWSHLWPWGCRHPFLISCFCAFFAYSKLSLSSLPLNMTGRFHPVISNTGSHKVPCCFPQFLCFLLPLQGNWMPGWV